MKLPSIFLFTLIMTNQFHSQSQSNSTEFSAEKKVMLDCDQRIFYEIFVRSFYDSKGDGIGDLNGITQKLDYLQQLGIGGLWLTPFHPSPSYHKYDVMDYYAVDPQYGTVEDFRRLVSEAHKRNILVLLDLVVNHTSWHHPWFRAAAQNDRKYRDYYVWEKDPPETKEGGWYYAKDEAGNLIEDEKYYAYFWRGMPDLNFDNPEVRKEIINVGLWWLKETGVDGYRLDAAQHVYDPNHPSKNVEWWTEFSDALKKQRPDVINIGECWNTYPRVAQYLPALSGSFNFQLSWSILKSLQKEKNDSVAELLSDIRIEYEKHSDHFIDPIFVSNHDNNRILSDLDGNKAKAKLAASIYLTLPGTPFIYYGEEIGMYGKKPDSLIREPFLWDEKRKDAYQTYWETAINSTEEAVDPLSEQLGSRSSFYQHYKTLIDLRKGNAALTSREFKALDLQDDSLLAYSRGVDSYELVVIHNLSGEKVSVTLPDALKNFHRTIYSAPKKIHPKKNKLTLPAYSTVILSRQ